MVFNYKIILNIVIQRIDGVKDSKPAYISNFQVKSQGENVRRRRIWEMRNKKAPPFWGVYNRGHSE
jgi:hypothetical protein